MYNKAICDYFEKTCDFEKCDFEMPQELTSPEIEELRKKHNEANDLATAYQKQIDEAFIALHNVPDFEGKWVKMKLSDAENATEYIEHVTKVERLRYGIRLRTDRQIFKSNDNEHLSFIHSNDSDSVNWENIEKIEIVDVDTVKQYMSCAFEKTLETFFE
jgi:hypothetical protein